jgi:hypothetical protein
VELTGTATSIVHGLSPAAEYRLMNMEKKNKHADRNSLYLTIFGDFYRGIEPTKG